MPFALPLAPLALPLAPLAPLLAAPLVLFYALVSNANGYVLDSLASSSSSSFSDLSNCTKDDDNDKDDLARLPAKLPATPLAMPAFSSLFSLSA